MIVNSSTECKNLYTALVSMQAELQVAEKSSQSRFNRYATLTDMVESSRPALTKHGIAVIQYPGIENNESVMFTRLIHKSGEWFEGKIAIMPIPLAKNDIQAFCGHITYLRRYSYAMMVGIVTEDDDGETAMKSYNTHDYKKAEAPIAQKEQVITREQVEQLEHELIEMPDIKHKLLDALGIKTLEQMTKAKFFTSIDRIREIKRELKS